MEIIKTTATEVDMQIVITPDIYLCIGVAYLDIYRYNTRSEPFLGDSTRESTCTAAARVTAQDEVQSITGV